MAIGAKLKSLVGVALLSGAGGFVVAGTVEGGASAPEATAAEAALSLRDVPVLEEAFIDTAPADRDDGIEVGELGVDGGDRNSIVELAREIAAGEHGAIDSLLIAHHGKLVFESYYLRGRVNLPHPQASATKAYTSLAIGRAIQLGHLTAADLERPLIGFFEDLDRTRLVEGAESITLHKAMTMSSGLRIGEERMEELEKDAGRLEGWGEVQAYLEQSAPVTGESQSFNYQGTDPRLVMQVLDAVVPGAARDFIEKELLDELGIAGHDWEEDASGLPAAGAGSSMTSRDMVKWGSLVRNKGRWGDLQLGPEEFIARATHRILHLPDDEIFGGGELVSNCGYGYSWWQADMDVGGKTYFSTSAQGGGGQFIILIDELDLIVVATGHEREVRTLQMTAERVLPAFIR